MNTAQSITARPWFICPTWAAVVPLLADVLGRPEAHEESTDAARAELLRLAQALDAWNERAPRLREHLTAALERLDEGEPRMAEDLLRAALKTLEATP